MEALGTVIEMVEKIEALVEGETYVDTPEFLHGVKSDNFF